MKTLGNTSLLERKKIGYFASGTIASLSVLPTLDWATEIAKREDVAIVSGFHSKMEREVIDILLRGRCGIICVLARPIYKAIPDRLRLIFVTTKNCIVKRNGLLHHRFLHKYRFADFLRLKYITHGRICLKQRFKQGYAS